MAPRLDRRRRATSAAALAVVITSSLAAVMASRAPQDADELREAEHDVPALMKVLDVRPGMTVADVGAGGGAMTLVAARWLGSGGRVFSTDIDATAVTAIAEAATRAGLANVTTVVGADATTNLPDGCCDAIWLRDVYHHLKDPLAIDRSLRTALKPGGRLAVIDFPPAPGSGPPPGVPANRTGHGITAAIVDEELTAAGFARIRTIAAWPPGPMPGGYFLVLVSR